MVLTRDNSDAMDAKIGLVETLKACKQGQNVQTQKSPLGAGF
jgi:hypothetical protein